MLKLRSIGYIAALGLIILLVIIGYSYRKGTGLSPDIRDESYATDVMPSEAQTIATTSPATLFFGPASTSASGTSAPKLERPIPENTIDLDEAYRERVISDLNKTVAVLKKEPYSYHDWVYLGLHRRILGDYDGAYEAWHYATLLSPSEEVAYIDLAYLYDIFLKRYAEAETYYKKGLKIAPNDTNTYRNLFEMYRYRYKEGTSAAEETLKEGIARNPEALDLYVLLARFYDETGRSANARAQFDLAIALAEKQGNTSAATQLEQEKSSIR